MKTLMLTGQKGGSGKTTLATGLAVAALQDGKRVVLVDLDAQASLSDWHGSRERGDFVLRSMSTDDFESWIARAKNVEGVSLIVVDTPGQDGPEVGLAYAHADFCLVPALPSALDLRAAGPTAKRLDALHRPFAFVLNGVSERSLARTIDATTALRVAGDVAPVVSHRLVFRDAFAAGLGVTEFDPVSKGAAEIRDLWTWVKHRMWEKTDVAA